MTRRSFLAAPAAALAGAEQTNAGAISGTWALQQAGSAEELARLSRDIGTALETPHLRGFCLRVPWRAADRDLSLIEAGRRLASGHGLEFSVRFMAGRHTPAHVFEAGSPYYQSPAGERVPAPFLHDGSPNAVFEREYRRYINLLACWCRQNGIRLLHLAWYGQDWAELNHGKEVRAVEGYSYDNWLRAHLRILDAGLKLADEDLACELPFSGYGPLTEAAVAFADHVVGRLGPANPAFFCQANGWGPGGDWGAPNAETEAAFDRVWARPICRGQQSIQPRDYDWTSLYFKLYENRATYCEVYVPSFLGANRDQLAGEVRKFAEHCERKTPLPEAG
jgi:hypothetical protein